MNNDKWRTKLMILLFFVGKYDYYHEDMLEESTNI